VEGGQGLRRGGKGREKGECGMAEEAWGGEKEGRGKGGKGKGGDKSPA